MCGHSNKFSAPRKMPTSHVMQYLLNVCGEHFNSLDFDNYFITKQKYTNQ